MDILVWRLLGILVGTFLLLLAIYITTIVSWPIVFIVVAISAVVLVVAAIVCSINEDS